MVVAKVCEAGTQRTRRAKLLASCRVICDIEKCEQDAALCPQISVDINNEEAGPACFSFRVSGLKYEREDWKGRLGQNWGGPRRPPVHRWALFCVSFVPKICT